MKAFYQNPEMEIVAFEIEDVITTSSESSTPSDGGQGNLNDIYIPDNTDPNWGDII